MTEQPHSFTPNDALKLTRLKRWRDLIAQLAEPVELRNEDTRKAIGNAVFEMDTVIGGYSDEWTGHFCPTAACAVGSAALHPWFIAQGLERNPKVGNSLKLHGEPVQYIDPRIANFFGLDHATYLGITNPVAYQLPDITLADVLERIDAAIDSFIAIGAAP